MPLEFAAVGDTQPPLEVDALLLAAPVPVDPELPPEVPPPVPLLAEVPPLAVLPVIPDWLLLVVAPAPCELLP